MLRHFVVAAGVVVALVAVRANAQSPAAAPRFEVASVKLGMSPMDAGRAAGAGGGRVSFPFFGIRTQPGGRLQAVANLQMLIMRAYGIKAYQVEGGPKWITTDYFDISAKAESETATDAEMNEMLKSLLAERFGLRVHVETRPSPVHTLTVARPDGRLGAGLKRTSQECEATLEDQKRTGAKPPAPPMPPGPQTPLTPSCGMTSTRIMATGGATYAMGGRPLSSLVDHFSNELGAPVVDQTGLAGRFDAVVEYESSRRPGRGPDLNSTDPLPVPLPQAVQQQLGLKLDRGTAPLPITIVDAAEPPSAD